MLEKSGTVVGGTVSDAEDEGSRPVPRNKQKRELDRRTVYGKDDVGTPYRPGERIPERE